ncbi:MAG TPA: ATP-binding protein [Ignavibacteriaceae bacterium]|nr:ATP-binding protein [Ignavibacteriaceae bacterium]
MNHGTTLIDFILNDNHPINYERYMQIKEETGKYLVTPLKVIALMVAISGIFAMIFEVRHHAEFSFQIYLVRLLATLVAFIILVFLNTKNATKHSILLVHVLLLTIISSSAFMILLIPSSLIVNSQIVGLMIFTSAMFLNWEIKNQILVAIYYNIVFAVAILFNDQKIYFLPNMFESLIFVLFLSLLSVLGSAINFRMRLQIAENAFRTELSEKKYRAIFDNSIDGIYQSTHEGKFLTVNNALVKMLGYELPEELMETNINQYYKIPEEREKLLSEIKRNGSIENHLLHLVDKNKNELTVKLNARLITDGDKSKYFYEGTMRDVTSELEALEKRKQAELELKSEKEKSDALAKEALKLSSAKSKFLANMSHEIRTPMNGILGFLSLIEADSYSSKEELNNFVKNAKVSAESLLETINAVLDLSKIEAGKLELENLNFNLKKIVEQAVSIVYPKAKEKSLSIAIETPDASELNFVGDPTKLRQIFLNLLSNAVKFTQHGEIKVAVSLEQIDNDRIRIHNSITDTGIGIPADKINKLFKPFSQVDGTEGKNFGGTGLGLVICKEFTNLMEGDISVKSNQGAGSQFNFSVVLKKQHISAEQLKELAENELKFEKDLAQNASIDLKANYEKRKEYKLLLAEDNLINQKVVIRMLNSAGYQVDAVMNGEQVLRVYSQKNYDLILMDVQMPEVDGYTATKKIREMEPHKNSVPIIAITAHALVGDREKCIEAGMNEYISKPVIAKEIVLLIDRLLKIDQVNVKAETEEKKESGLFDFERLKQISLGDPVFEKDLLGDFIIDAESKLKSIQDCIAARDASKIINLAHTLKGSSYSVGATSVGDEALGIELSAKNNDIDSVEERLSKLSKSIRDTREIIKNKI